MTGVGEAVEQGFTMCNFSVKLLWGPDIHPHQPPPSHIDTIQETFICFHPVSPTYQ